MSLAIARKVLVLRALGLIAITKKVSAPFVMTALFHLTEDKIMSIQSIASKVRALGYQLACREIYGENTPEYYELRRAHGRLLERLYKLEKRS